MVRAAVSLSAGLIAVFCALFAASRAQPRSDDLRDFLVTDGCPACWLGIEPGVTTLDEALALLRSHPWVSRVSSGGTLTDTRVYWFWSEAAPAFARTTTEIRESYLFARNNIIRYVRLTTRIPYGSVRLIMGEPQTGSLQPSTPSAYNRLYFHTAGYFEGRVAFDTNLACPARPLEFWNDPVVIIYSDGSFNAYNAMPVYNLIPWVYETNCIT